MQLTASIFKAYDIRGVTPTTINEDVAFGLGHAFGAKALAAGEKAVAVGRDGRLSGPALAEALMRGLAASGVNVLDVGMVTTPMLYFAANTLCTSGVQVTGSHNPKDYNGFKMVLAGRAIYGDEIQALHHAMVNDNFVAQLMASLNTSARVDSGTITQHSVADAYHARIVGDMAAGASLSDKDGAGKPAIDRLKSPAVRAHFAQLID